MCLPHITQNNVDLLCLLYILFLKFNYTIKIFSIYIYIYTSTMQYNTDNYQICLKNKNLEYS